MNTIKAIPYIFLFIPILVFAQDMNKTETGSILNTATQELSQANQIIKAPILKIREDKESIFLVDCIDSVSMLGDYPSYTLTWADGDLNSYSLKSQALKDNPFNNVTGVYYTKKNKPIYVLDIQNEGLEYLGFYASTDSVEIIKDNYKKKRVELDYLGLTVNIRNPNSRDRVMLKGALDGNDISKLKKTTNSECQLEPGINQSFKKIKDASVNANLDTVKIGQRQLENFSIRPIKGDRAITLYRFDDSYNGRIINRLVDSVMVNNPFCQLGIVKVNKYDVLLAYVFPDIDNIPKIKGCLINQITNEPIFIYDDVSDDILSGIGIAKTDKQIILQRVTFPFIYDERLGYGVFVKRNADSSLKIYLKYNNQPIYGHRQFEPFKWLLEE